ncbi:MAG: 30S ribosome-binding factor RbfA [Leptolyngbyaceae cyanobacterium RM2_2_4]|nr:30S ribosome-binding factor RbfA [Leptolyngbyaceae cyanobacterium SM1_4_3]NJO51142.1 30S ribosome-binding factor RbfA [Leptolyngbyaceae cyanobacterium RM2_2_4]
MATSRRVARVSELIKREVSQLLMSGIKDDRVGTGMVSVTNVNVSGDLQHAKIFVSIYGSDEARAATMAGLKSATGFVRSELGQRMRLRRTPEVVFVEDRSIEQGTQVLSLLNRLSQERKEFPLEDSTEDAPVEHNSVEDFDEEDFDEEDLDEEDLDEDGFDEDGFDEAVNDDERRAKQ